MKKQKKITKNKSRRKMSKKEKDKNMKLLKENVPI